MKNVKTDFRKYNLEDLKYWMWVEACEGYVKEFDNDYKKFVSKFKDEEVSGEEFCKVYFKIEKFIDGKYIDVEDLWLDGYFEMMGVEDEFEEIYEKIIDEEEL